MKEETDISVVKSIIEEKIAQQMRVSKYYVLEEIKIRIDLTRLHSKILTYDRDRSDGETNNGERNISLGANKVFRDAKRGLKKYFDFHEDGWITAIIKKKPEVRLRRGELLTYGDKSKTMIEWSEHLGIKYNTLLRRIQLGWKIEDVFEIPVAKKNLKINKGKNASPPNNRL